MPALDRQLRAAVVDAAPVVRFGLPALFPEVDWIGLFATAEELIAMRPSVDVVVLELKLSGLASQAGVQGPPAVAEITSLGYPVLVHTSESRPLVLAHAMRAGARGLVSKCDDLDDIAWAIRTVGAGGRAVSRSMSWIEELAARRRGVPELTSRQRQVLTARARGLSWHEVASSLFITECVAREHMAAASAKIARFVGSEAPADLEWALGLRPGDVAWQGDALQQTG